MTAAARAQQDCAGRPLLGVSALAIRDVSGRQPRPIVSGFELELAAGEFVGFVGESGSGKSLTARAIAGLALPGIEVSGRIEFDGRDIAGLAERERARLRGPGIALVLQDPFTMLDPLMRCGDQVIETLDAARAGRRLPRDARRREMLRRLAEVGIPDPAVADRYPFQLSGGMRQRVALACALSRDPRLLIADEPTTALDAVTQRSVLELLRSLQRSRGMTVILITHDLGLAFSVCDRVGVIYAGSLLEIGPSSALAAAPEHPYTLELLRSAPSLEGRTAGPRGSHGAVPAAGDVGGRCAFAARCTFAEPGCTAGAATLAPTGDGRRSACRRVGEIRGTLLELRRRPEAFVPELAPQATGADALAVTSLCKAYSQRTGLRTRTVAALDEVSLRVRDGETVALLGESGSGKTTLGRCVAGLERPDSGTIEVAGGVGVQMVFQDPYSTLNPMISVGGMLREIAAHCGRHDGSPRQVARDLLRQVGLPGSYEDRKPAALSGGERQRIAIARALAARPRLIVLDEPVSALDVSVQGQVLELLRDLQDRLGFSYLFITHDLAVVRQVAHRVYVMKGGRIVEEGDVAEVIDSPRDPYTRQLRDSARGTSVSR